MKKIDELVKMGNFDPNAKPGQQMSRPDSAEGRNALASKVKDQRGKSRDALPSGMAGRQGQQSGMSNHYVDKQFPDHNPMNRGTGRMQESANLVKRLRTLLETEVSQAEVMMAAKGFAQELQEMVEKIGRLQNEDLPPVTDQMRETYGMESASAFQTQIYGALQSVMDALYTAKGQVDDAVGNMAATGQVTAAVDMDKDIGMDDGMGDDLGGNDPSMDGDLDLDNIGDDLGAETGDEFGGASAGEEPLGRAMKEATLQKKIVEIKKLVQKARRLQEAQR